MRKWYLLVFLFSCCGSQAQTSPSFEIFFSNSNRHYHRNDGFSSGSTTWQTSAWRGERVHTKLLVNTSKTIKKLGVEKGPLIQPGGFPIAASYISIGFINGVIAGRFGKGCSEQRTDSSDATMADDPIDFTAKNMRLPAGEAQALWLSIDIPANAKPGVYKGSIGINADGKKKRLEYSIKVQPQTLPPPSQWTFHLDLWQHPVAIARVHKLQRWSDAHFRAMRPYYTLLAGAGQKVITASIIDEPWNHQTYDDFPSLIRWIKTKNGAWQYDYALFDKYIQFVMNCGISEQINCYTMVPWKMRFTYFDASAGRDTMLEAGSGTPAYRELWTNFLTDFRKHLLQKGWFGKTSIAMDERPLADMKNVIAIVKAVDPEWKISLAGDHYLPEIHDAVYDYSIASKYEFGESILQQRNKQGRVSTFYTCCVEPYPNGFTFSPPAESTFMGWHAAAKGFDGYLRWAYNSWVEEPLKDSRGSRFPGGDTYYIYPGPQTSARFEKLREGIQDYEKIRILRQQFTKTNQPEKLARLEKILKGIQIVSLSKLSAEEMISAAKQQLAELGEE